MPRLAVIARLTVPDPRPDGELLRSFLTQRDESAFAELVRRHGPVVWWACRRTLPDPADAEDAFQASFLVLVRKADRLTKELTVGPWLYRVAAWTARNLRRKNARRLSRTSPLTDVPSDTTREPAVDLDAALLALPEAYRTPLVLCCLKGLTRRDAAERLGCPEGTLSTRLARGLVKLRARLLGRDPLPLLALAAAAAVPSSLSAATERAAAAFALASLIPAASGPAAALAHGVLRMFWFKKVATAAVAAMVLIGAAGVTVGVAMRGSERAVGQEPAKDITSQDLLAANLEQIRKAKEQLVTLQNEEQKRRAETETRFEVLSAKINMLERQRGELLNRMPSEPAVELIVTSNRSLQSTLADQRYRLGQLETKLGNRHPTVLEAKNLYDETKRRLDAEEPAKAAFVIIEREQNGDVALSASTWSSAEMIRQFARIRKDPQRSKDLVISVSRFATTERVQKAFRAANDAGYRGGRVKIHTGSNLTIKDGQKLAQTETMYVEYVVGEFRAESVMEIVKP